MFGESDGEFIGQESGYMETRGGKFSEKGSGQKKTACIEHVVCHVSFWSNKW